MTSGPTKNELIESLIRRGVLRTPLIIEAFEKIDRADFVLSEYHKERYGDYPLPIGHDQTISQPYTVAFMLELLGPQPGEKILDIGAGSGWQAALLAYITSKDGARGRVVSIERVPELKEMAEQNIAKYGFIEKEVVKVVEGDASKGYSEEAPFKRIIAAAASDHVRVAWKEQLMVHGRLVAPVGTRIEVYEKFSSSDFNVREYDGFRFVPLVADEGGNGGS
ncbi:protein-L-isoaspartate O-methyltransferase [Candidatus Parcubacteria bacterium]|nr:MAG: protein-L-isoaspartate O-methyltransferase [Candidatus Parcubacteria bacterium]